MSTAEAEERELIIRKIDAVNELRIDGEELISNDRRLRVPAPEITRPSDFSLSFCSCFRRIPSKIVKIGVSSVQGAVKPADEKERPRQKVN